jgi:hypothetical protein
MRNATSTIIICLLAVACDNNEGGCNTNDSDKVQRQAQEKMLAEATSQVGMPAIKNFRERKLLKDILELRDQTGLVTYTYVWNEFNGKPMFFCNSIGYPFPYATQFTNPAKPYWNERGLATLPQADPNGLFSPSSAEGTWVMCSSPKGDGVFPVYVEPRVIVSPFKLDLSATPEAPATMPSK